MFSNSEITWPVGVPARRAPQRTAPSKLARDAVPRQTRHRALAGSPPPSTREDAREHTTLHRQRDDDRTIASRAKPYSILALTRIVV